MNTNAYNRSESNNKNQELNVMNKFNIDNSVTRNSSRRNRDNNKQDINLNNNAQSSSNSPIIVKKESKENNIYLSNTVEPRKTNILKEIAIQSPQTNIQASTIRDNHQFMNSNKFQNLSNNKNTMNLSIINNNFNKIQINNVNNIINNIIKTTDENDDLIDKIQSHPLDSLKMRQMRGNMGVLKPIEVKLNENNILNANTNQNVNINDLPNNEIGSRIRNFNSVNRVNNNERLISNEDKDDSENKESVNSYNIIRKQSDKNNVNSIQPSQNAHIKIDENTKLKIENSRRRHQKVALE